MSEKEDSTNVLNSLIKNLDNKINYVELIILDSNTKTDLSIINTNWTSERFDYVINEFIKKKYNILHKTIDIYKYQNLEYHIFNESVGNDLMNNTNNTNNTNIELKNKHIVYSINLDNFNKNLSNNIIYNAFIRNIIPTYLFPSTMNVHDKYTINRYTIKISNRIYLNFEIEYKQKKYYRIYLNYNYNSKIDITNTINKLNEILNEINCIIK